MSQWVSQRASQKMQLQLAAGVYSEAFSEGSEKRVNIFTWKGSGHRPPAFAVVPVLLNILNLKTFTASR